MAHGNRSPAGRQVLAFVLVVIFVPPARRPRALACCEKLPGCRGSVLPTGSWCVVRFIKGLAIAFLVVLAGGLLGVSQASWWRQATFSPMLETAVLAARPWLPDAVAKRVRFD